MAALAVLVDIALATSESVVIRGNAREMASSEMAKLRATAWGSDEGVNISRSGDEEPGEGDGRRGEDAGEHAWCCSFGRDFCRLRVCCVGYE